MYVIQVQTYKSLGYVMTGEGKMKATGDDVTMKFLTKLPESK